MAEADSTTSQRRGSAQVLGGNHDSIAELRSGFQRRESTEDQGKLAEIQASNLRVELYHKDVGSNADATKFLGQVGVADSVLQNLPACALRLDMPLRRKPGEEVQEHVGGQMIVKVHKMRSLRIDIRGAKNLKRADGMFGKSDPYCVVYFQPHPKKEPRKVHTTAVIEKELNPNWEHEFVAVLMPAATKSAVVRIEVWDKDQNSADEFLGEVLITSDQLETLLKPQAKEGEPNISEFNLMPSTVPAYANMKKYVGGSLALGTFEEKTFKISIVEANGLAHIDAEEGEGEGCSPQCRIFWKDELVGKTTQIMKATEPIWAKQDVEFDWSKGDILNAELKRHLGNINESGDRKLSSSEIKPDEKELERMANSMMPKAGRRGSLLACPPQIFDFLADLATQIQSLDESVSDMFQHLDISCNGSLCASELQEFFKEKGREFSDENVKMIFDELDADKSGSIDLGEFEHLVRIANKALDHQKKYGGQQIPAGRHLSIESQSEQPVVDAAIAKAEAAANVEESASAPALDTEQPAAAKATPVKKLEEAQQLDADINAG